MMMDIDQLDDECKKRTERIDSITALVIVIDKIPTVSDKEPFLPVLEKLLKSLSGYDQAEVVTGLGNRLMAIALVMRLVGEPEPALKSTNNGLLLVLVGLIVFGVLLGYMFHSS